MLPPLRIQVLTRILAGSSLAGLELLQVPPADLHVATIVVQALREALCRVGTVIAPLLLLCLILLRLEGVLLLRSSSLGAATTKHASDGMADGGTDGNAAVEKLVS
jgi:branched-subunit amino acid permease